MDLGKDGECDPNEGVNAEGEGGTRLKARRSGE